MSSKDIFLGRQPILNSRQNLVAYELLFRSSATLNVADIKDAPAAAADVILNALYDFGGMDVLGRQKGFINVETNVLMTDTIELLPKERIVIEILESVQITDDVVKRCLDLKKMGFVLAVDDFSCHQRLKNDYDALFEFIDVIKIDILEMTRAELSDLVQSLKRWPAALLAEKVEDHEQYSFCSNLGFQLFQGFYFAKPSILSRKRIDVSKITLLELLDKVLGDSSTKEIEASFKQSPELVYNLLRLVNSVGMEMRSKIETLQHAIVVLGREQLKRWVQLLLFSHGSVVPSQNPLMQMAATRGKMMELLVKTVHSEGKNREDEDLAFMVGILSLLDTLLGISMEDIVGQITLKLDVKAALLTREGMMGQMLLMIENIEEGNFSSVEELLQQSSLTMDQLLDAQLKAITWTNKLIESM